MYLRYRPTTTLHMRYTSHVFQRGQRNNRHAGTDWSTANSHACKTPVIPTLAVLTRVSYIYTLIGVRVKTSNTVL